MTVERIKLFEADIDVDGIIKKSVELKQEMNNLKLEQQKLKSTLGDTSEEFIKNEAVLKKVSAEYNLNQKQVSNLSKSSKDFLTVQEKLTTALNREAVSIDAAADNNKELKKLRGQVNTSTVEGAKAIDEINKKINQNTEFIKSNVSENEKLKIGIGGYREQIKSALGDMNPLNNGLSGMFTGLQSITKASLAFIATPLGAILAVLIGAFALVKAAMSRSEESTNKIKVAFSAFGGIISKLLKILEPVGKFLIDGLVKGFELVEKGIYQAMENIAKALDFLGFEDAAASLRDFNAEVQQGAKDAKALAEAEAQLIKVQREAKRVQLEYQKDAEKLRQLRDNENLSIKERIRANEDLGAVLQKQLDEELKIAKQALIVSNLRIKAEGQTTATLDAQAEALTEIADIQERITSQQSEQLTNRVSLEREASEKAKEYANKRIETAQKELELIREQRRFNEQNLEELKFLANEEVKIIQQKFKDRLISETEYKTQVLKIQNDIRQAQIDFDNEELERIKEFHERKNELEVAIDLRNIEDANERAIAKANQDFEKQVSELEQLQLNEQQKTELLALLEIERDQVIGEIKDTIVQDQLAKQLEANQKLIESDKLTSETRAALAQTLTNTLTGLLGESLAAKLASIAIEAGVQAGLVKLEAAAASGKVASSIASANAAAIAISPLTLGQPFVTANTVQGAVLQAGIVASSAQAISRILAGAALKGVGTLAKGVTKKAEHGAMFDIGGNRHSAGGTKFYGEDGTAFEAEKGEKMFVLNRRASAALSPLLSGINQKYGGISLGNSSSYLAAGGQVIRNAQNSVIKTEVIDYDKLANMVSNAVADGAERGAYNGSSRGTHTGIVEREEMESISNGANF